MKRVDWPNGLGFDLIDAKGGEFVHYRMPDSHSRYPGQWVCYYFPPGERYSLEGGMGEDADSARANCVGPMARDRNSLPSRDGSVR